jgi:hypothetical protein
MERVRKNEDASEGTENPEEVGTENPEEVGTENQDTPEEPVEEAKETPLPVDPDPIISWKKIGGGSLRLPKKLIPPGGIFKARISEIPKGFRDVVIPMEPIPDIPAGIPSPAPVKTLYVVQPRGKSKSMFDVIAPNGKKINEKPLSREIAERLAKDLS